MITRRLLIAIAAPLAIFVGATCATASVTYIVEAGWLIPGSEGSIPNQGDTPPQTASSGDFSFHGGLCPAPGSTDYLCANVYAQAGLSSEGVELHASARASRHDAVTLGSSYLTHGEASVQICGWTGTVATPVSVVKFHLGLAGTTSTSSSNAGIFTQAFGTVRVNGQLVQCDGAQCGPVVVPSWNPAGCDTLDLRADASFANIQNLTGWDADVNANFADTLKLLAVEPLDDQGHTIPGLQFSITDAQNQPVFTFPATPPSSTTTTSTIPGGSSTTSTTLPGGCDTAATYVSVLCRLDALLTAITDSDAGPFVPKLTVKVAQAKSAVDRAQQALGKRKGRVSKAALRKAEKSLKAYAKLLDTKKAAKTVPDGTRSNLKSSLGGLQSDVAALPTT